MSVLIVTSLGDIVVDLFTDRCPLTCKNFLKLCKIKYYNGCLFHTVQKDFTAQTGDPTGIGSGGDSVYKFLYGDQARFFTDEIHLDLKHGKMGTIAMASAGENFNASQFYFTLRDDLDYLDGKHTVFGEAAEGLETLGRINEAYVDDKGRPYKNIRIKHTYILDDPFDDPCQLAELIPEASPEGKPKEEVNDDVRLEDDWVPMDEQVDPTELEEIIRTKDAHSRAVVLESIGDIPDAEIKPPDNVLFVCKLNPVTEDEDLHTIFSRFGVVVSAEVIRDFKTGDSLCYAFIEFETNEACEQAYFKMDNTLIDDRRIHVDFSQSVARLWSQYRRGHKGKGCFKCGALDHVAKDCTGGEQAITKQHSKYVLKDDNTQRGGGNSRYEMVFDGNNPGSPEHKKRHRDREREGRADKQRARRPSSEDTGHREDERLIPRKRSPPRVDEFFEEKIGREKQMERERRHSRYEREDRERNLGSGDHRRKADGFADRDTSDKKKSVVTYRRKSEYSDDHNREGGRDYGRQQTEEVQNRHRKNRDKSYDHEHRSRRR